MYFSSAELLKSDEPNSTAIRQLDQVQEVLAPLAGDNSSTPDQILDYLKNGSIKV